MAAGAVYSLEAELGDLEERARAVGSATPDMELSFLEEQVASAAAKVRQSDLQVSSGAGLQPDAETPGLQHEAGTLLVLQVSNISARIAALKNAGLNVDTKTRTSPVPVLYPFTYCKTLTCRAVCRTF